MGSGVAVDKKKTITGATTEKTLWKENFKQRPKGKGLRTKKEAIEMKEINL